MNSAGPASTGLSLDNCHIHQPPATKITTITSQTHPPATTTSHKNHNRHVPNTSTSHIQPSHCIDIVLHDRRRRHSTILYHMLHSRHHTLYNMHHTLYTVYYVACMLCTRDSDSNQYSEPVLAEQIHTVLTLFFVYCILPPPCHGKFIQNDYSIAYWFLGSHYRLPFLLLRKPLSASRNLAP